jgi:protein involved in polysaccharide export with SLBB domain
MEVISVDINSNYSLQRGDRIIIIADETQRKEFSVSVIGEVKSPGKIPITKNTTTLKEVIDRAGGFTENASLKQAKVFTGNLISKLLKSLYDFNTPEEEQSLLIDTTQFILNLKESILYRMSNVTYEDRDYFKLENQMRNLLEMGSVDFTKLEDENSDASRFIVKDENVIFIPARQNMVYVFGQVPKPGRISYHEGMDYKYYIEKAGGLGEYAQDEDEIMIIKGDTKEWISPSEHEINIEEGDYVYVPREANLPFNWYIGQVGNYLSIVASAATIILLLIQFNN